jgi:hypothetical protein
MCIDGCDLPNAILLDIDMHGATETRDGVEYAIAEQRVQYCVRHASEYGLYEPVNRAIAVPVDTPNAYPFPNQAHFLYGQFAWVKED